MCKHLSAFLFCLVGKAASVDELAHIIQLLLYHTADFNAVGQGDAEGVEACSKTTEVER